MVTFGRMGRKGGASPWRDRRPRRDRIGQAAEAPGARRLLPGARSSASSPPTGRSVWRHWARRFRVRAGASVASLVPSGANSTAGPSSGLTAGHLRSVGTPPPTGTGRERDGRRWDASGGPPPRCSGSPEHTARPRRRSRDKALEADPLPSTAGFGHSPSPLQGSTSTPPSAGGGQIRPRSSASPNWSPRRVWRHGVRTLDRGLRES